MYNIKINPWVHLSVTGQDLYPCVNTQMILKYTPIQLSGWLLREFYFALALLVYFRQNMKWVDSVMNSYGSDRRKMLHKNGRKENCSQKIVSPLIYYTNLNLTFTVKTAMKFTIKRGKSRRNSRPKYEFLPCETFIIFTTDLLTHSRRKTNVILF